MIINSTNNHQMVSKDKEKKLNNNQTIFEIKDSIIPSDKRSFYPNWNNQPPKQKSIITSQETDLLKTGGQLCITAKAGVGKSSICEAIISNHLNPNSDGLGFEVHLPLERNKILYIDTERSQSETWDSWERTLKRSEIEFPNIDNRLIFGNYKAFSLSERMDQVKETMSLNSDIGLIIFDGGGDFVNNTNDIVEANLFINWINTFNPNISLIFTIHTNPKDNKPRGHLGSELCRRANSVLLARKKENEVVEITSEFEDGKVRHGGSVTWYYKFDIEYKMFKSLDDYTPKKTPSKSEKDKNKYKEIALKIWGDKKVMYFSEIVNGISEETKKDKNNSKAIFNRNFSGTICERNGEDGWKLINN
jgi:hypothetical protein